MNLEVDRSYAGQEAQCGACHGRTIVPNRQGNPGRTVTTPPPPVLIPVLPDNRSGITVPILISAIVNILAGAFWVCTACGIVIGVPMLILAVFEFILYSQADDIRPQELITRAQSIAIFQIICGLFNLISLICGIIVLINAGKYQRRTTVRQRARTWWFSDVA
jgi:hypothetical protein